MNLAATIEYVQRLYDAGAFNGYGPRPIPHALDAKLVPALRAELDRDRLHSVPTSFAVNSVFGTFAERMASLAVRQRSPEHCELALAALVIVHPGEDFRVELMSTTLVYDAATRCMGDADRFFSEFNNRHCGGGSLWIEMFRRRKPELKTLTAMGFEAGEEGDGFRYRYVSR